MTKKVSLDVDTLVVESFTAGEEGAEAERGTVRAQSHTANHHMDTCGPSCVWECAPSSNTGCDLC